MRGINHHIKAGQEIGTDEIWQDPADPLKRYRVFYKMINTGALPNISTKNVAHGITNLAVDKFMEVQLWSTNGTRGRLQASDPTITVDVTNVVIVSTTNLSGETASVVQLKYCKTDSLV